MVSLEGKRKGSEERKDRTNTRSNPVRKQVKASRQPQNTSPNSPALSDLPTSTSAPSFHQRSPPNKPSLSSCFSNCLPEVSERGSAWKTQRWDKLTGWMPAVKDLGTQILDGE